MEKKSCLSREDIECREDKRKLEDFKEETTFTEHKKIPPLKGRKWNA